MKDLPRILKFIKPYWGRSLLNVLFNVLSVIFSLFSLAMIVPVLELLFRKGDADYAEMVANPPSELEFSAESLKDHFYYELASMISSQEDGRMDALILLCILIVVMFLFKNLCRYLAKFYLSPVRSGVVKDIRGAVYQQTLLLPLSYYSEEKKGDLMSKLTSDVQEIENTVMNSLEAMLRDPVNVIVFFLSLLFMSPQLTLFVVVLFPIAGYLIGGVGKSLRRASEKTQTKMGELLSVIEETLTGIRIIKAFNAEENVKRKFGQVNSLYEKYMIKKYRKRDMASPLSELLGVLVMVVVLWYGGKLVLSGDTSLSASVFIAYIAIFSQLIPPAKSFTDSMYNVQRGMAAFERIKSVLDSPSHIKDGPDAKPIQDLKEKIEYQKVTFRYQKEYVVRDVDLCIKKGETVALVGRSGSGKSTIADLLPRFYDVEEGEILIDGHSIREVKIKDLRSLMGIVTQESILFNDSIYNNIAFGMTNVASEDVVEAAKVANAHEFIEELDNGYHTNIGDQGNKLSGGQKQRISIARAILKNPPILILDEATSALDTESEKLVQDALEKLMKQRTSLVIAHRLSTIQHADRIFVLEDGNLVESGNHDALLEKGGVYKKLYDLQSFE